MTTIPAGWGGNNYYANYGVNPPFFQNSTIADGVFALREAVGRKITDILDGSSNTAAFSEMGKGDFNNAKYTITDWLNACAAGMPTTPDQANTICNSIDPTNLSYQWRSPGGEWLNDSNSGIAYYHIRLPNTWTCAWPCNLSAAMTANSYHGGGSNNSGGAGVNVVLCDGSVRFITNGISMATWRAVGTRAGEEILGGDY